MIEEKEVPDSWTVRRLDEVSKVILGNSPPGESYNEVGDGPPFIQGATVFGQNVPKTDRYTSEPTKICEEGDTIIAIRATIGDTNKADREYCLGRGAAAVRAGDGLNQDFLHGYLDAVNRLDYWRKVSTGATFNSITKTNIQDLNVPVPPLDEQERIVESVEDRLERVERLEKSVENVDRLVGEYDESLALSLMSGGIKKQASVPPENTDMPEEWEVVRIKDVAQVETGGTPKTSVNKYWGGDITWIRVSDMPEGMYVSKSEDKITETGLREGSCSLVQEGGVVLSTRATIGKVAIADEEMATNQGFKSIIPKSKLESEYLAYYLDSITEYLESLGKGATYDEINKSQIQNIKIPLPPSEKQKEIVNKIESLDSERLRVAVESVGDLFSEYRESILSHAFQNKINY